jgi:hypothetical protein
LETKIKDGRLAAMLDLARTPFSIGSIAPTQAIIPPKTKTKYRS